MELDAVKAFVESFKSVPIVRGRTTINHNLRIRLGLSCDEYVLINYFSEIKIVDYLDIYSKTGLIDVESYELLSKLSGERKLIVQEDGLSLVAYDKFLRPSNYESLFDIFWDLSEVSIMKKTRSWPGSKSGALKKFILVMADIEFDYLMKQRDNYVKFLQLKDNDYRQMMIATRWLGLGDREFDIDYSNYLVDEPTEPEKDFTPITKDQLKGQYE